MAWPNIEERRKKVEYLISIGVSEKEVKYACADEFSCSRAAITDDIHLLMGNTAHLNPPQRNRIKERDRFTCQYCGTENPKNGVIEHVVPFALGGVAKDYNLVFACQKCNTKKKRTVWIPNNLLSITESNIEWREKIMLMALKKLENS